VLNALRGCHGALCHEYDHIVPFSKGGLTKVKNCQILQTDVNRHKSNSVNMHIDDLKRASKPLRLSHQQMDLFEYAIYGDVRRKEEEQDVAPAP